MDSSREQSLQALKAFLVRVPGIQVNDTPSRGIGSGSNNESWWMKFGIDIHHRLAWRVVQEFAHVLNLLSVNEPLPTIFKPVSPRPT